MPDPVLIGLGSNLGDRRATLDAAVAALGAAPHLELRAVSRYHETVPVGGPPGQGPFLNAAVRLAAELGPFELLDRLQAIERDLGRVRRERWGQRTLDLDLLLYEGRALRTPRLTLPHPRMAVRRFVLAPSAEVAPEAVDPATGRTIAWLLGNIDRRPAVAAFGGPPGPSRDRLIARVASRLGALRLPADDWLSMAASECFEAARRGGRWVVAGTLPPAGRDGPTFAVVPQASEPPGSPYPILTVAGIDDVADADEVLAACEAAIAGETAPPL